MRKELIELNEKYSHVLLDTSENTTFDNSDFQTESSFEEPIKASANTSLSIENITEKLGNLNISTQKPHIDVKPKVIEIKKTEQKPSQISSNIKPVVAAEIPAKQVKEEPLVNKIVKKPLTSLVRFKTQEVENAHEDLITCLDICSEKLMLVTGRFVISFDYLKSHFEIIFKS